MCWPSRPFIHRTPNMPRDNACASAHLQDKCHWMFLSLDASSPLQSSAASCCTFLQIFPVTGFEILPPRLQSEILHLLQIRVCRPNQGTKAHTESCHQATLNRTDLLQGCDVLAAGSGQGYFHQSSAGCLCLLHQQGRAEGCPPDLSLEVPSSFLLLL